MMNIEITSPATDAEPKSSIFEVSPANVLRSAFLLLILLTCLALVSPVQVAAQAQFGGNINLWGDVKIDDSKADSPAPLSVTIILYDQALKIVGRQNVSSRGRYRFNQLLRGEYELVVEAEGEEISRMRINLVDASDMGVRQDFEFEWKSRFSPASKGITGVISTEDIYNRSAGNKALFQKAQDAAGKKKYDQAITFLKQIIDNDKLDFPVWTLLGTLYVVQEKTDEAEQAYLGALEAKPSYVLALMHLGRLRASQKKFDQAIEPLTRAVELRPTSAEANLMLGEAYLQIKKGSKAIPYLDEAAKLGKPEAHLRLGWLYDAAKMREKAVIEYQEFLKKNPNYADRKKLEKYISDNKKG
jgi:tetratricopeptide (TPR) repeat protein